MMNLYAHVHSLKFVGNNTTSEGKALSMSKVTVDQYYQVTQSITLNLLYLII